MTKKIALFISVKQTTLGYSNKATFGVDAMARSLQYALTNAFSNFRMVQGQVRKQRVIDSIFEASQNLEPGGVCLIYYHGHGDTITGYLDNDEYQDQALVCYDGYLLDDELDQLLRNFHSNCRVITIMDCCSSNSIVEWKYDYALYPQIMHIASAKDKGYAMAGPSGGVMSREIIDILTGWEYTRYSYGLFSSKLKRRMKSKKLDCFININPQFTSSYLRLPLFK